MENTEKQIEEMAMIIAGHAHHSCKGIAAVLYTKGYRKQSEGAWDLEVHSFYVDTWDESIEFCVFITAKCSNCGEKHRPHQVFSKHLYAPEDADSDFRFDQEYEKSKALEEFKRSNYEFQNFCPNCGAKMKGE